MKALIAAAATYFAAFIFTYGHAYHQVGSDFAGNNAVGAFLASAFWPLYWSVQVWK